ncbi:hypothetical protein VTK73DRAFT_10089 [Phialemonium thermophilum]|uniref:Hemerythrin-like domain-containing protein n=1 Tax=Phialemonium thermophilum TaxID=223376 RepID=A0ABR3VYS8_9PEZI
MAPVYADHPFSMVPTPIGRKGSHDKADTFDRVASDMAMVHNLLIRGLNAIYLQAPYVQAADEKHFFTFINLWATLLELHHDSEETDFFPAIETLSGEKGIMDANVEQHRAFHDGLTELRKFIDDCAAGREKYNGRHVVELIDKFGPPLAHHLADEIPSIENLRKYGSKLDTLEAMANEEAKSHMKQVGLTGLTVLLTMLDCDYEGGLWANWPPAPNIIKLICRYLIYPFQKDVVKFSPSDRHGNLKPLYAVPPEAER